MGMTNFKKSLVAASMLTLTAIFAAGCGVGPGVSTDKQAVIKAITDYAFDDSGLDTSDTTELASKGLVTEGWTYNWTADKEIHCRATAGDVSLLSDSTAEVKVVVEIKGVLHLRDKGAVDPKPITKKVTLTSNTEIDLVKEHGVWQVVAPTYDFDPSIPETAFALNFTCGPAPAITPTVPVTAAVPNGTLDLTAKIARNAASVEADPAGLVLVSARTGVASKRVRLTSTDSENYTGTLNIKADAATRTYPASITAIDLSTLNADTIGMTMVVFPVKVETPPAEIPDNATTDPITEDPAPTA